MPRAQKGRAGITDLRKVAGTVNQKVVQKKEARDVKQTLKPLCVMTRLVETTVLSHSTL